MPKTNKEIFTPDPSSYLEKEALLQKELTPKDALVMSIDELLDDLENRAYEGVPLHGNIRIINEKPANSTDVDAYLDVGHPEAYLWEEAGATHFFFYQPTHDGYGYAVQIERNKDLDDPSVAPIDRSTQKAAAISEVMTGDEGYFWGYVVFGDGKVGTQHRRHDNGKEFTFEYIHLNDQRILDDLSIIEIDIKHTLFRSPLKALSQ